MITNPEEMPPSGFASIASIYSIMGIVFVSSIPTPPAVLAAAAITIFVKKDDKNEKADIAELMTFYKDLLLNGPSSGIQKRSQTFKS